MARSRFVHDIIMRLWPLGKVVNWLASRPVVGPLFESLACAEDDEAIIIPIAEVVQGTQSVVLPYQLLAPMVAQASTRVLLEKCLCRQGENCQTYPHGIGCLFLGPGAAEIHPSLGRVVDVNEALAHLEQGMEAGLLPSIVHSGFDAWLLGIPYRRELAVCFCCECCCSVHQSLRAGPPRGWESVTRLPGLSVEVGPECSLCGTCQMVCPVSAISKVDGQMGVDDDDRCKGCGRCAAACPEGAITLRMAEGVDVQRLVSERVQTRTDILTVATDQTG